MKYEVINISTTSETYIANGILTHNKGDLPASTDITVPMYIQFGSNYAPQYPYTLYFDISYDNSAAPLKSAAILESSPITVNNSSQLNQEITIRITKPNQSGRMPYTASAKGRDNLGVYSSGSTSFVYDNHGKYFGVSGNCLVPETMITLYDNSLIYLKEIEIGDELLSIDLSTMQYIKTVVTGKQHFLQNELFYINDGLLKSSDSHNHIVKRNGDWIVQKTYELLIGDILLKESLQEITIDKIEIIK